MKHVIVTGASSGIGLAITALLSQNGYKVSAMCRSYKAEFAEWGVTHLPTDLRSSDSIRHSLEAVDEAAALINSAGVAYQSSTLSGELHDWDEMWEVNVRALAICSQMVLGKFPQTGGQIINLSSMSGHRVPPSGGFYASTKFAVRALCESLRLELRATGNPTRVSSISPGFVDTPMLDVYFRGREGAKEETRASGMMLSPSDIAAQVRHILETPLNVEIGDISLRSSAQAV